MKQKLKILFTTFPADGHINPLTGLAVHLKSEGHDVKWYVSSGYIPKMKKLGIDYFCFDKALEVQGDKIDEIFPERKNHKSQLGKLKFDLINVFILRGPEYFNDLQNIYKDYPFDLVIADVAFTAVPMIREIMNIPVITISILPLCETSKDLGPYGLGLTPKSGLIGKLSQTVLRSISDLFLFRKPFKVMKETLGKYGIKPEGNLFDTVIRKSNLVLQSGTASFDYYRSDLGNNVRYIGPLLPVKSNKNDQWYNDKLGQYNKIILVTQGTVEKDFGKVIVPTLEAYKNTDTLVIVTTGGTGTAELRKKYPFDNIIVEDFIPFDSVMPYADVYVTNGGYGGVMLSIQNSLPMVVAGVHEGKNEICARVGYFELGINLRTETPSADQIKLSIEKVLTDNKYRINISKLAKDFARYDPSTLLSYYINQLINPTHKVISKDEVKIGEAIY